MWKLQYSQGNPWSASGRWYPQTALKKLLHSDDIWREGGKPSVAEQRRTSLRGERKCKAEQKYIMVGKREARWYILNRGTDTSNEYTPEWSKVSISDKKERETIRNFDANLQLVTYRSLEFWSIFASNQKIISNADWRVGKRSDTHFTENTIGRKHKNNSSKTITRIIPQLCCMVDTYT